MKNAFLASKIRKIVTGMSGYIELAPRSANTAHDRDQKGKSADPPQAFMNSKTNEKATAMDKVALRDDATRPHKRRPATFAKRQLGKAISSTYEFAGNVA